MKDYIFDEIRVVQKGVLEVNEPFNDNKTKAVMYDGCPKMKRAR